MRPKVLRFRYVPPASLSNSAWVHCFFACIPSVYAYFGTRRLTLPRLIDSYVLLNIEMIDPIT